MPSHLETILEIVRQLGEIGSPVPAAQVRGVIAGSLPATTYDSTLRENRRGDHGEDEDPMSIHRFCDALRQDAQELLHKEKRMTNAKISSGEPGMSEDKIVALIARQLKQQKAKAGVSEKPRGDRDQTEKRCHHCGKKAPGKRVLGETSREKAIKRRCQTWSGGQGLKEEAERKEFRGCNDDPRRPKQHRE